jgi:phosphoglycolate phosphatase
MLYRLVIFDFDGTLADSAACFLEALNDAALKYRFRKIEPDEMDELRGQTSQDLIRRLGVPSWKLPSIARHMQRLSLENAGRIPLFPGIATMLMTLDQAGAQIAVVTSNAQEAVQRVIGPGLTASIDHFECGASFFGKARRVEGLLQRSGIAASDAIFIGDETRDIEAAQQAGVAAAAVLWGYAKPSAFDRFAPLPMFSSVEALTSFLTAEGT